MKKFKDIIKEGNEGYSVRDVIDNLDEEHFENVELLKF